MCRYDCGTLAPLVGEHFLLLCSGEYATCEGKRYVSNSVMDSYIVIKHKTWRNAQFISSAQTNFMLGDMSNQDHAPEWHMYNLQWNFEGLVFLPYVYKSHWCLLVLDVKNGTITHYVPMQQGDTIRGVHAMTKFQKYLTDCERIRPHLLCYLIWTITHETERRPIQTDAYNCAIYVMHIMDCLGQQKPFDMLFDADAYRLELQNLLLEESQSMENNCLNCWNDKGKSPIATCISCQRWAHKKCKSAPVDNCSNCALCSAYFAS